MKRYLEEPSMVVAGQSYLVAKMHGGNGMMGGFPFTDGLFMNGNPVDGFTVHKILGGGYRIFAFPWEPGIQVEWRPENGEPRPYVEEADKPEPEPEPKPKGRKPKPKGR